MYSKMELCRNAVILVTKQMVAVTCNLFSINDMSGSHRGNRNIKRFVLCWFSVDDLLIHSFWYFNVDRGICRKELHLVLSTHVVFDRNVLEFSWLNVECEQ